jgi:hypothetical protein
MIISAQAKSRAAAIEIILSLGILKSGMLPIYLLLLSVILLKRVVLVYL